MQQCLTKPSEGCLTRECVCVCVCVCVWSYFTFLHLDETPVDRSAVVPVDEVGFEDELGADELPEAEVDRVEIRLVPAEKTPAREYCSVMARQMKVRVMMNLQL